MSWKDDINFMKSIAYLNRNDDFIAREFGNMLVSRWNYDVKAITFDRRRNGEKGVNINRFYSCNINYKITQAVYIGPTARQPDCGNVIRWKFIFVTILTSSYLFEASRAANTSRAYAGFSGAFNGHRPDVAKELFSTRKKKL